MTITRNPDGKLDSYVWPGGYPLVYVCDDGGELCPDCANQQNGSIAHEASDDPSWRLIGADVHWEGEPIICDHCNAEIESAYGPE